MVVGCGLDYKLGVISQERLKIEVKLLLSANRKSYMPRKLAQQRMTFSDLEWPFYALRALTELAAELLGGGLIGASGNVSVQINIVALRQAWLTLYTPIQLDVFRPPGVVSVNLGVLGLYRLYLICHLSAIHTLGAH